MKTLLLFTTVCLLSLLANVITFTNAQIPTVTGAIGGAWGSLSVYPIATTKGSIACGDFNGTASAFIVGGIASNALATAESFSYNFTSGTWDKLRNSGLPPVAYGNLGIVTNRDNAEQQKLVFLNGYSLEIGFNSGMFIYDSIKRSWTEIVTQDAPSARRGAGSWFHNDTMVIFGGATENKFDNNIYILRNIFSSFPSWTTNYFNTDLGGATTGYYQALAPTPRFGQCCATYFWATYNRDIGICFGGTTESADSDELWLYLESDKPEEYNGYWFKSTVSGGPSARRDHSCAYIPSTHTFVVYGGFSSEFGGTITDRVYHVYDIASDSWSNVTQPAVSAGGVPALSQAAMCGYDSSALLVGGLTLEGGWAGSARLANASDKILTRIAPNLKSTPSPRYFHNSVAIGDMIYILFGADDFQAFSDVWSYNTSSEEWKKVTLTPSDDSGALPARFGATLVNEGTTLYIFGGASWPFFAAVRDLVVIELTSGQYRIVTQSGTTIPYRLNHVMLSFPDELVVGTGITTSLSFATGWYKFNLFSQTWTALTPTSEVKFRYGMSSVKFNDTHNIIGLGYGSRSNFDWYLVTRTGTDGIKFQSQIPGITLDSERRRLIRMFATTIISGNQIFVCGGQVDPETPPARGTLCYHWNIAQNKIYSMFDLPVSVSGASAEFVRDKMYIFGGRKVTSAQLLDEYSDSMQIYAFNRTKMCSGYGSDTDCLLCGAGTINPNCDSVYPGSYLPSNSQTPVQCPSGTFLPIYGAASDSFCLKCPANTYSQFPGAEFCQNCTAGFICPLGSTNPLGKSAGYGAYIDALKTQSNLSLIEFNPPPYETPQIPWFPVLLVAVTTVVLAIGLAVFVIVNRVVWKNRFKYYLPNSYQDALENIYKHHSTHIAGMSESNFIEACHNIEFPPHRAHAIELQKLFFEVDSDGTTALGLEKFFKAVILMIQRDAMDPLPGSDAATEGVEYHSWVPDKIKNLEMSNFDMFSDSHRSGQIGDDIRNQQTWAGGFLSLVYYVAIVILVLAIVINFAYANIVETKAAVPRAVIQASFGEKTVAIPSDLRVRVALVGPLHGKTLDTANLRAVCIKNNAQGTCNDHTAVTVTGVTVPNKADAKRVECTFNEKTEECEIEYFCKECYIPSKATLLFEPSQYHSADAIRVRVYSTTGIRNPLVEWTGRLDLTGSAESPSWVERRLTPSSNKTVFTGNPATIVGFGVTPTFVEANQIKHTVDPGAPLYLASGYHVRPNGFPSEGNAVAYDAFDRFHGCPIKVEIVSDVTPLFVRRVFIQTSIQLIVSLLGAISGLGGGILAAVAFTDGFFNVNENSQQARDEALVEKEGVQALYENLPKVADEDVDDLLYLIERGYSANVAKELLDIVNENAAGDSRRGSRKASRRASRV